jgi:hypothetical protein
VDLVVRLGRFAVDPDPAGIDQFFQRRAGLALQPAGQKDIQSLLMNLWGNDQFAYDLRLPPCAFASWR